MKKLLTIVLVMLTLISLTACKKKEEEPEVPIISGLANPRVEYQSIEEVNEKLGINLKGVGAMGITDKVFATINDVVGEYKFTLNGRKFTLRGSKNLAEDISGIYVGESTMFAGPATYKEYSDTEGYKGIRFVYDDVQYVFTEEDAQDTDYTDFMNAAKEIEYNIAGDTILEGLFALLGEYTDDYSMRATMSVDPYAPNAVSIVVKWGSSVDEYDAWYIVAKLEEDKLTYEQIEHYNVVQDTATAVNDALPGHFEIDGTSLKWTGSGVEQTSNCVFVRTDYSK